MYICREFNSVRLRQIISNFHIRTVSACLTMQPLDCYHKNIYKLAGKAPYMESIKCLQNDPASIKCLSLVLVYCVHVSFTAVVQRIRSAPSSSTFILKEGQPCYNYVHFHNVHVHVHLIHVFVVYIHVGVE